jgi:cell division septal protein FtsQ
MENWTTAHIVQVAVLLLLWAWAIWVAYLTSKDFKTRDVEMKEDAEKT